MAYIGHFEHIPAREHVPARKDISSRKSGALPRFDKRRLARWGYYAVLVAIALVPIIVPIVVKYFGLSF